MFSVLYRPSMSNNNRQQNSPGVFKNHVLCIFNKEYHTDSIYLDNYPGELSLNI